MKSTHLLLTGVLGISLFFTACQSSDTTEKVEENQVNAVDTTQFLSDLKSTEEALTQSQPTKETLKKALTQFQDYAGLFPNDPKSAEYLHQAADIAYTLGQAEKAVKILNRIIDNYPDYKQLEAVYFTRASHFDFELRDTTLAKQYYQEFTEMYPESDFVDDAQSRMKTIHMTAEELVEYFEQNQAELNAQN